VLLKSRAKIEASHQARLHIIMTTESNTENTTAPAVPPTAPVLPDRLASDPRSPFHVAAIFEHDIGIRFNNVERRDVEEYCVSEGWVKVAVGNKVDRRGNPLTIKLKGTVEPYYR
jgi:Protein of unknown function (DUF3297)